MKRRTLEIARPPEISKAGLVAIVSPKVPPPPARTVAFLPVQNVGPQSVAGDYDDAFLSFREPSLPPGTDGGNSCASGNRRRVFAGKKHTAAVCLNGERFASHLPHHPRATGASLAGTGVITALNRVTLARA